MMRPVFQAGRRGIGRRPIWQTTCGSKRPALERDGEALATGLRAIPGVKIGDDPQANILFCQLPMEMIRGLLARRFTFYHDRWEPGVARFVTSIATSHEEIEDLLAAARQLAS